MLQLVVTFVTVVFYIFIFDRFNVANIYNVIIRFKTGILKLGPTGFCKESSSLSSTA